MEEKELAETDINNLTAEILILKQQTAQNIIEIGKRLIKVKESLLHGEWGKWLEEKVDFSEDTARNFIRVANAFPNSETIRNLSISKVYSLLNLPSEERKDFIASPHEIDGETKTVDEMTTRQLQQAIKEKKEAEVKVLQLEKDKQELQNKLTIAVNKPAETVTVDNTDYDSIEKLKQDLKYTQDLFDNKKKRVEILEEKIKIQEENSEKYIQLKSQIELLTKEKDEIGRQIEATTELSGYIVEIRNFLKTKLAPIQYSESLLTVQSQSIVIKNVTEIIECVEKWCQETRKYLPKNQQNIINVEVM